MSWAENIVVSVSGLSRSERKVVGDVVENAGGRYTPSLSRRCTHLVVSHDVEVASSKKLALALHNKAKWGTHIVSLDWIAACTKSRSRVPEQDYAGPSLQEEITIQHRTSGDAAHQVTLRAYQQADPPSSTPSTAAPAFSEVPSARRSAARARLSRQRSKQLSRFAPGSPALAQENESLLQHPQQPSGDCTFQPKDRSRHARSAAAHDHLTVEASGPAFARRCGSVARILHPAQQPLRELPDSHSHQQTERAGLGARPAAQPAHPSADAGAMPPPRTTAPWQMQQQQCGQSGSGVFRHPAETASVAAAESAIRQDLLGGGAMAPAEAGPKDLAMSGTASAIRQGVRAEGQTRSRVEAGKDSGGVSTSEGGLRGRAEGWTERAAAIDSLAKALLSLRTGSCAKGAASGMREAAVVLPGGREGAKETSGVPKASDRGCPPELNSVPRCTKGCSMQPAASPAHWCSDDLRSCSADGRTSDNTHANLRAKPEACQLPKHDGLTEASQNLGEEKGAEREACVRPSAVKAGGAQQQHEEPEITRGVFYGMRVVVDSGLDKGEAERVREAITAGGGQCTAGAFLGASASHVVCLPSEASQWLAMGVHVVSPSWVLQSARSGRQERCLQLSADALRGIPSISAAANAAERATCESADDDASSAKGGAADVHAWQALLDQADQRASMMSHHQTPANLLEGIVWTVTDPPEKAWLEKPNKLPNEQSEWQGEDEEEIVPDSEDEGELATAQQESISSALAVAHFAAIDSSASSGGGSGMSAGEWDYVILMAPALTVLFPADAVGALCHVSRSLRIVPPGLSRRQLLAFVHAFYQERLTRTEMAEALQGGLRCTAEVRGALLAGQGVCRGDLLGSRRSLEGLSRVSRSRNATVYELELSC